MYKQPLVGSGQVGVGWCFLSSWINGFISILMLDSGDWSTVCLAYPQHFCVGCTSNQNNSRQACHDNLVVRLHWNLDPSALMHELASITLHHLSITGTSFIGVLPSLPPSSALQMWQDLVGGYLIEDVEHQIIFPHTIFITDSGSSHCGQGSGILANFTACM